MFVNIAGQMIEVLQGFCDHGPERMSSTLGDPQS